MDGSAQRAEVKSRAKDSFEANLNIWPEADRWSAHTRRCLTRIVQSLSVRVDMAVLNVGCGGNDYGIGKKAGICINLDLSPQQCRSMSQAIVADAEAIPIAENTFDLVLCIGAVLNYCEPYAAIAELFRVAKPKGQVIIDFETTTSAELLFLKHWGKRVSVIERSYAGRLDKTLLFSADHVRRIIHAYGEITKEHRYHIATAFWLRVTHKTELPNFLLPLDRLAIRIPALRILASNSTFVCRKR